MTQLFANNAVSTVADNPLAIGATTLNLAPGTGALFPSPTGADYFYLTLTQATNETSWEIVKCTARSTDALTITRAQESTAAAQWAAGSKAELRMTSAGATGFLQKVNDLSDVANASTAFSNIKQAATESATGVAEIATQAEVTTGTDDVRYITPLKLSTAVPAASETAAGKIEIATAAETTTGTDDVRAITPLKLTTFAPASVTVDTANDKVLFLDNSDSNKVKQGSFPSASGSVTLYRFTDSTDVTVSTTCASGGTAVSSTQTINIPTSGKIRVFVNKGRFLQSTATNGASIGLGISVGATNYFRATTANIGGTAFVGYAPMRPISATAGDYVDLNASAYSSGDTTGSQTSLFRGSAMMAEFDIASLGCSTGSQTVGIRIGKKAHDSGGATQFDDTFVSKGTVTGLVAFIETVST